VSEDFSPDASEFRCLVPFPDESQSFVHGFEAGMIWRRMNAGEAVIGGLDEIALHVENEEVFRRMGAAHGYTVDVLPPRDGWITVMFTKNPKRFGVVEGGRHDR
jgi:hypothetical protein